MRRRGAACLLLALLATACSSSEPDPADRETAQQVAGRYADLLAAASVRPVSDAEIDRAGIDRATTPVRSWLDYFTCALAREGGWAGASTRGQVRLLDVDRESPTELSVRATLYVTHEADLFTPGYDHVLQVVRRGDGWAVVADQVLSPWRDHPVDDDGPAGTASESSTATDRPWPCSHPGFSRSSA